MIREHHSTDLSGSRELRVKIGVDYHLKLHTLKILRNKSMSTAVQEALDQYFKHMTETETQRRPDSDLGFT